MVVWALAAIVLSSRGVPALGAVVAGAAVVGGICAVTARSADLGEVHVLAASLVPAVVLHLELVLPDGHLGRAGRRNLALAGYAVCAATGVALALASSIPAVGSVATAVISSRRRSACPPPTRPTRRPRASLASGCSSSAARWP